MKLNMISKKTRPVFFFLLVFLLFFSQTSFAQAKHYRFGGFNDGQTGMGAFLGDPLGLRAYYFTSWKRAFAFSLGYASSKDLQASLDYIFYGYSAHDKVIDTDFFNSLIFYGGLGLISGVGLGGNDPADNFQIGGRLVGGVEYIFVGTPWSMRIEVDPEFFAKAKNAVGFALGIGFTYYFGNSGDRSSGGQTRVKVTHNQTIDESEFNEAAPKRQPASDHRSAASTQSTQKSSNQLPGIKPATPARKTPPLKTPQLKTPQLKTPPKSKSEFDEFN